MKRIIITALVLFATADLFAVVRGWTGLGADDNFSTPENWDVGTAPQSGDTLVFMGDKRTSPVNDLNSDDYIFTGLVFSNTSATCSAPFTIKGNKIRLSTASANIVDGAIDAFAIFSIGSKGALTDIIEADVEITDGGAIGTRNCKGGNGKHGSGDWSYHHLTFKGTVTGNGGDLKNIQQSFNTITFEGPVKDFKRIYRPNGAAGGIVLKSPLNEFTDTSVPHEFCHSILEVFSAEAFGGAEKGINLGQKLQDSPATLKVTATSDVTINGDITVLSPLQSKTQGTLNNNITGGTLTLGGNLSVVSGGVSGSTAGATVLFTGKGDGNFTGSIISEDLTLKKEGAGTWVFAGESCVATGKVSVTQGTLLIDGDYSSFDEIVVTNNATFGGSGSVSNLTFEVGSHSTLRIGVAGVEGAQSLTINGMLSINGDLTIDCDPSATLPAGINTILTFSDIAKSDNVNITFGDNMPKDSTLLTIGKSLVISVPATEVVWKGDTANNVWDYSSYNWMNNALFADAATVRFNDSADEGTEKVEITSEVSPHSVNVTGTRNYTFSGKAITGYAELKKESGDSILTIANTNTYTGATTINDGALVLSGELNGSSLVINEGAVFTNTITGRITGDVDVRLYGTTYELDGTNDFTGNLYISCNGNVLNSAALGLGDIVISKGTLNIYGEVNEELGRGRTIKGDFKSDVWSLTLSPQTNGFKWLGDIEFTKNAGYNFNIMAQNGTGMIIGEPNGSSVIRCNGTAGLNFWWANNEHYHVYSRFDLGGAVTKTHQSKLHLYAKGNKWSILNIHNNQVICEEENTLAVAPVLIGEATEWCTAVLDLNGHNQTITELIMNDIENKEGVIPNNITQTVKSDTPATLTISNDVDTVTERNNGTVKGAVSLRKIGDGNWSFGMKNESSGDFVVEEGTLTITADDSLPTDSVTSTLKILAGAKVVLPDGVNATVSRLNGGRSFDLPPGIYGGEGCTVPGAQIDTKLFGAGGGSLRVLKGDAGVVIIIR